MKNDFYTNTLDDKTIKYMDTLYPFLRNVLLKKFMVKSEDLIDDSIAFAREQIVIRLKNNEIVNVTGQMLKHSYTYCIKEYEETQAQKRFLYDKRRRYLPVDFNKLPFYEVFERSLPRQQQQISKLKRKGLRYNDMIKITGKTTRYLAVVYYIIRKKYSVWILWYKKNYPNFEKRLNKIENKTVKEVAWYVTQGYCTKQIETMMKLKPGTAMAYTNRARKCLTGNSYKKIFGRKTKRKSHISNK